LRALRLAIELRAARPRGQEEENADDEERDRRQPRDDREEEDEDRRDAQRLRHPEELARELVAERRVRLLARDARDEDAGGGREDERRDLRDEPVADREQPVALERVGHRHPALR